MWFLSAAVVYGVKACILPLSFNYQFRTVSDKGNPTV